MTRRERLAVAPLLAAFLFAAFNFRPSIVAVSPLLSAIRAATGLSAAEAGTLVTVPLVCFGLLAPISPVLARRRRPEVILGYCLAALAVGIVVRALPTEGALFLGTILIGVFVAVANVLMPGLVKEHFSRHVGLVTGLNLVMVNGSAAIAAGATVPLAGFFHVGWRLAISWWAVTAALSAVLWVSKRGRMRARAAAEGAASGRPVTASPPGSAPVPPGGYSYRGLGRSRVAWALTIFMGLQSFDFYSTLVWLPTILHRSGYSLAESGWLLSLASLTSVASSLAGSLLAGRRRDQRVVVVACCVFIAAGVSGVLFSIHHLIYLWMVVLGTGQGAAFAVFLVMVIFRSHDPAQAISVGGMAQGIGYLLGAAGPTLMGGIFDATRAWTIPLVILLVLMAPQAVVGYQAARDRFVTKDPSCIRGPLGT